MSLKDGRSGQHPGSEDGHGGESQPGPDLKGPESRGTLLETQESAIWKDEPEPEMSRGGRSRSGRLHSRLETGGGSGNGEMQGRVRPFRSWALQGSMGVGPGFPACG